MTDTTGIVVDIGAPSLTGKYADQLVRDAFAGVTYPLWVIVTNHLEANVSLPEVDGLFLRPISTASANYALVEVNNADQLQQLAASMEQVAISNNSPLAISLNEVPNYGYPVATPTNLNIVPPSMPEPSSHIVPVKTINGVSILGYGDVALDIIDTGAKIDDAAGAGALTVVWSAHKIDEAINTHTHSNYALKSHTHEYADVAHTHTGFASATHDHAADYAPLNHAHAGYAPSNHNHNADYSPLGHTHTGFAPMVHTHTGYASDTHDHDTKYAGLTHTHTGFAADTHTHSNYSLTTHNHTGDYAGINHTHSNYSLTSHDHSTLYADKTHTHTGFATDTHTHSNYALTSHNHDADYADITHTHTIAIADVTGLSAALASVTPSSGTTVSTTSTATLTNKTISMASNSLTGTTAEFNAALSDGDFCTLDGTETLTNKTITGLLEKHVAIAAEEIDLKTGNLFSKTITGATTFSVKNVPAPGSVATFILHLSNPGANVTWWAGVKWQKGIAPTLTAAGTDVLGFYSFDGGASWTGIVMAKDVK